MTLVLQPDHKTAKKAEEIASAPAKGFARPAASGQGPEYPSSRPGDAGRWVKACVRQAFLPTIAA